MSKIVNEYLDELNEGIVLIGMGLLAATLAAAGVIDKVQSNKAENILQKNKQIVDRIIGQNIKDAEKKTKTLGMMLNKTLKSKFGDLLSTLPKHIQNNIDDLAKANYENELKKYINRFLKLTVKYKRSAPQEGFFSYFMEIGIDPDAALESAESSHPEFSKNNYRNPTYKIWDTKFKAYENLLFKADKTVSSLVKMIIENIVKELNKLLKNKIQESSNIDEAGFEDKPEGWTDKSIKKYSKSFTKKMKGNVKSKGFFDKCVKKMQGKIDNPEGFCAALKDEAHDSTYWRGKGKTPKEVKKDVKTHQNV